MSKTNVIMFIDIDGVLAENKDRLKYIEGEDKNYDKFYGACMADDKKIQQNGDMFYALARLMSFELKEKVAFKLIALTGRPERTATLTKMWVQTNFPELYTFIDEWVFRPDHDRTPSSNFKARMFEEQMDEIHSLWDAGGGDWYVWVFDDDPTNIASMTGKSHRNNPNDMFTGLTVGTELFTKLMRPPAFACNISDFVQSTSDEGESSCQTPDDHQDLPPSIRARRNRHR